MGAYFQLLTPGIPELGGWVYMGPYEPEAYWYEFTGVMTNCHADRRLPRRRPARGDVRDRAARRRVRADASARTPRTCGARTSMPPSDEAITVDHGPQHRLRATTSRRSTRALELAEYDQLRKEQQARRDRGDTKQLGIGLSTYIEMCGLAPSKILGALRYAAGGWDAAEIECRPDGKVVVTHRHVAARAGARDRVVADRRRRTRCRRPTTSRCCTATPRSSRLGMDTYGSRSASVGGEAVAASALEKVAREGPNDRRARARGQPRTTSSGPTARSA